MKFDIKNLTAKSPITACAAILAGTALVLISSHLRSNGLFAFFATLLPATGLLLWGGASLSLRHGRVRSGDFSIPIWRRRALLVAIQFVFLTAVAIALTFQSTWAMQTALAAQGLGVILFRGLLNDYHVWAFGIKTGNLDEYQVTSRHRARNRAYSVLSVVIIAIAGTALLLGLSFSPIQLGALVVFALTQFLILPTTILAWTEPAND